MKYETLHTVRKHTHKALVSTLVVCVLLMSSFPAAAYAQKFSFERKNPEIKYLGTVKDKLLFQIDLQSVSEKNQYVSIKDEEGNILFTEKIRDNQFSRKFAFDKEEFEGKKVSFVIHDGTETSAQTFQVSRNLRMVEDVVITRL